jgi:hypothetical protein
MGLAEWYSGPPLGWCFMGFLALMLALCRWPIDPNESRHGQPTDGPRPLPAPSRQKPWRVRFSRVSNRDELEQSARDLTCKR